MPARLLGTGAGARRRAQRRARCDQRAPADVTIGMSDEQGRALWCWIFEVGTLVLVLWCLTFTTSLETLLFYTEQQLESCSVG